MRNIYNFILRLVTTIVLPIVPVLLFSKKIRSGLKTRLGWLSKEKIAQLKELGQSRVWFHAASVGELSVVAPIIKHLKKHNPKLSIILTTNTLAGLQQVEQLGADVDCAFLAPLDYPGVAERIIKQIAPSLTVITETEIWPNLILTAKKMGSQLALVNGRMSEKNVGRYKLLGSLIKEVLEQFELLTIQTESDASRYIRLGANRQRVKIISNVKSDNAPKLSNEQIRLELKLKPEQPVWVAGSTRPGEEEQLLDAFVELKKEIADVVLVLAPRHLGRLKEIEKLLVNKNLLFVYRSALKEQSLEASVILLDTMGELANIYACAQVAFVGGTLAPFGGHNPLEPALHHVPVILGPHVDHFSNTVAMLTEAEGAVVVNNQEELSSELFRLFKQPKAAKAMGERAGQVVLKNQGSATKTAELLLKLMLIKQWSLEVKTWRQDSIKKNNYNLQHGHVFDNDWLVR